MPYKVHFFIFWLICLRKVLNINHSLIEDIPVNKVPQAFALMQAISTMILVHLCVLNYIKTKWPVSENPEMKWLLFILVILLASPSTSRASTSQS